MAITWFNENQKVLVSTIYDNNITLNKTCVNLLEHAYSVMLGLDYEEQLVHIKPLNKEEATRGDITSEQQYKITVRNSYARVCNISFINEIKKIIGIDKLNDPKKFVVNFDEKDKTLVIDLKRGYENV